MKIHHHVAATLLLAAVLASSTAWSEEFVIVGSRPNTIIIDGGFLHALAPGMRADVFLIAASPAVAPRKAGTIETREVSAYESKCWFEGELTLYEIAEAGGIYPIVEFSTPERTDDDLKRIAEDAFEKEDWPLAQHYLQAYLNLRPDDSRTQRNIVKCGSKIEEKRSRKPTSWEATAGMLQRHLNIMSACSYLERGKFDHARAKIDEMFFIYSKHPVAEALLDRIDRLESLPPDVIYLPSQDSESLNVTLIPAWPFPGQKLYLDVQEDYRSEGLWKQFHVLVDERGKPLVVQTIGASGNGPFAPDLIAAMYRTEFSPCLRNGLPVITWARVTIGDSATADTGVAAELDPAVATVDGHKILIVRLIASDPAIRLLMIVDGGWADGLHDGLIGGLQTVDSAGEPVVVADVRIIDAERHQAWCEATVRPGLDPRLVERACASGEKIEFAAIEAPADSLQQLAVAALGSADHETAAVLLTRVVEADPGNASARTALDRCIGKLVALEARTLTTEEREYESGNLDLYFDLIGRYCADNRTDRLQGLIARVRNLIPDCECDDPCQVPFTCHPDRQAITVLQITGAIDPAKVSGALADGDDSPSNHLDPASSMNSGFINSYLNSRIFNPYLRHPAHWLPR